MYVNSMCFRDDTLDEWKRLAGTIAVGALLLFRDGVEDRDAATYEPFEMVNGRSRVRSTKRRAKWERAVQAHGQLVASERFGGLTPEKLGGLFLLTHTPDHLPHEVEAFDLDFWMLRVMHLSLERNVDLRMNAFALTEARSRDADDDNGDAAAALRQLETIVALKVAIFYKKRHRDKEADPAQHALCVSRHDVEETKRKCLQRPHAPKPQRESVGVADYVRVAMNTTSLQQLVPVGEVLKRACEERTRLSARIHRLDQVACTHEAWQRAVAQQSAALQARLAQEHGRIAKAGGDAADMRHKYTADVVQRMASDAAKAELSTTGLRLQEEDSVWSIRNTNPAVHKLVAVGAGGGWRPRVLYVRTAQEQKDKFGTSGTSGFYGSAAIAKAARLEMHSLVERLLALLTLEFRLRESSAAATVLPVELHQGPLIVVDGAPCSKVPEHVEAYVRALRTQRTQAKHEETFATAVQRALVRAIKGAFFGCFEVVSFGNGCGPYDPAAWTHPRERASLAIMHRMLNIAARFNGLVAQDCEDEEAVPVVVYEREAETFHMADFLEHAVVHNWPAVRGARRRRGLVRVVGARLSQEPARGAVPTPKRGPVALGEPRQGRAHHQPRGQGRDARVARANRPRRRHAVVGVLAADARAGGHAGARDDGHRVGRQCHGRLLGDCAAGPVRGEGTLWVNLIYHSLLCVPKKNHSGRYRPKARHSCRRPRPLRAHSYAEWPVCACTLQRAEPSIPPTRALVGKW